MRISDWSSDVCSSDLHVLSDQSGQILEWPRHHHQRAARVGGCLPETLVRRQDRALHAWRELHGLLLVENLRQRRDRNVGDPADRLSSHRSEEHTSELQSLMRISYAVFGLKKKKKITNIYKIEEQIKTENTR